MRVFLIASLVLLAAISQAKSSNSLPELTQYLKSEVESAYTALDQAAPGDAEEAYFLRRWMVRVQAPFGIKVPWVAKFQIVPEVELVWQRSYPDGWSDYKP